MSDNRLKPWMLRADWREDARPWLLVDLAGWPADLAIEPAPPVPLIGVGPASHPQARGVDVLLEEGFSLRFLTRAIEHAPMASASLVELLRATEGLPPEPALALESFCFAMLQGGAEHDRWLQSRTERPAAPPGRVRVERRGDTLEVVLDRPQALNAIDRGMRDALFDAFSLAAPDPDLRRVRLTATGRCFSMGADLSEFGAVSDPAAAHAIRARTLPTRQVVRRAGIYEVHVRGACVGSGLELAAFADRITASPDAWFQLPETSMGILPGFGGCVSIPRRIGRRRAALLMLSGKRIGAASALRLGLVDAVMDDATPDQRRADELGR
jgi:enoyl-CoA hydratase/carnithine racemase